MQDFNGVLSDQSGSSAPRTSRCCCTKSTLRSFARTTLPLPALFFFFAGVCNSVMDTLAYHYSTSIFSKVADQEFWNPDISWLNKYKGRDPDAGPKFFGSTTFLVWTTDAWHLFKSLMLIFFFLGVLASCHCWIRFSFSSQNERVSAGLSTLFFVFQHLAFSFGFNVFWEFVLPSKAKSPQV